jgi:hypothetical protein
MNLLTSARVTFALLLVGTTFTTSCSSDGFGRVRNPPRLIVELDPTSNAGSPAQRLPLAVDTAVPFKFTVRAVREDGSVDTTFNRHVRIATKPGAIDPLTGPDTDGRNLLLRNGESVPVELRITNAYGITYVVADDLGYIPADPLRDPPPACSNGIDDDGDGAIDFPADNGCAFANDDDEQGGTFGQGVSTPIYFTLPRIADVRGLKCRPGLGCSGNGRTPYPREQIQLDVGNGDDGSAPFNTVVTRLSADGFYVTDLDDKRGGFTSIFAFNFNAPPRMRTCDRMKTYGGTANEFFGFTQIAYPTWILEEWDPAQRPCLVPEPERLSPGIISDTTELLRKTGSLVRVETAPDKSQKVQVTPNFGPGDIQKNAGGLYIATPEASNCDFDRNGRITFDGNPESVCSTSCSADPTCTEWSNWIARQTFRLTVTDANGASAAVQADASASSGFSPVALKGVLLRSFAGTLHFFSGGSQFTIEVRCKDDITVPLDQPTFVSDKICATDNDCAASAGLPPDFKCVPVPVGATKVCRKLDPARPDLREPPPLACVFPRTFLENNPQ